MLLASAQKNTDKVKEIASQLGFAYCGISKAEHLEEEEVHLTNWLQKGYHGKMQWMEGHFDKRVDPTKLVDGAKSVVSLLFNYYPEEKYDNEDYKIPATIDDPTILTEIKEDLIKHNILK